MFHKEAGTEILGMGVGEMAQWFGAHAALPEDPSSELLGPLAPGYPTASFWLHRYLHTHSMYSQMQRKLLYEGKSCLFGLNGFRGIRVHRGAGAGR